MKTLFVILSMCVVFSPALAATEHVCTTEFRQDVQACHAKCSKDHMPKSQDWLQCMNECLKNASQDRRVCQQIEPRRSDVPEGEDEDFIWVD